MNDCELQTFTVRGPGGGGKDTSNTGVRIIHAPSGAVGEAREERRQSSNKVKAFRRMAESKKMQTWLKMESAKRLGKKTPEQLAEEEVERLMSSSNLKVEFKKESGEWSAEHVK